MPPDVPAGVATETVYLSDYGRHTRLALPDEHNRFWEWGFGDYDFYALEDESPVSSLRALSYFGRSTLARRRLIGDDSTKTMVARLDAVRTVAFEVERQKSDDLLRELQSQWERGAEKKGVHHARGDLQFVHADQRYHLFRNSNAKVAAWLRALGCEVRGAPLLSNFVFEE